MNWTIPGTTLVIPRSEAGQIQARFQSMFLAGGMVLSQVTSLTGLDPYMIQNWVKRGFLPKPEQKRYSLNQLCRIITIHMLKAVLPMERICGLLDYDFASREKKMRGTMGLFGALEVAQRQYDLAWEVRNYLSTHPNAAVVNLGCGLDDTVRKTDNGTRRGYNVTCRT